MEFKNWLLTEGINYVGLTKMWKKFFPHEKDQLIHQKIDQISEADPTPNKEYTNWLVRELLNNRIRLPEDVGIIQPDLVYFHDLKRRNQLKRLGVESNIEKYTRHQLQDKVEELRNSQTGTSKRKEIEEIKSAGAEKLYQDQTWMVVKATTPEACISYGKGTRWCTAALNGNMSQHYLKTGPLYIIWKNKAPFAQLHTHSGQLMDPRDEPIEPQELPEDIKNILFAVIPRLSEKDHWFFYLMTGKLDDEAKETVDSTTTILYENESQKLFKSTSFISLLVVNGQDTNIDTEFTYVSEKYPVYGILSNANIYWQFNLNENDSHWLGYLMIRGDKHLISSEYTLVPWERQAEIANRYIIPKSLRECMCLFHLTGKKNSISDKFFNEVIQSVNLDSLDKMKHNIIDPIYSAYKYFSQYPNEKTYEITKTKLQELVSTMNDTYEKEKKELEQDVPSFKTRFRYQQLLDKIKHTKLNNLGTLYELVSNYSSYHPDKEKMEYMLSLAKNGTPYPLFQFTRRLLLSNQKMPWGDDGWLEAEPYFAQVIITYKLHLNYGGGDFIERYAKTTKTPKETTQRLNQLVEKEKEQDKIREQKKRDLEDEMWK